MGPVRVNRRAFGAGALTAGLTAGMGAAGAARADDLGISHGADAIRQEVKFKATPARVYRALTVAKVFDKVVRASAAMSAIGALLPKSPTLITATQGARFSLFGGYISGRNVELEPDALIVQAWRSASWPKAAYSIARFTLAKDGRGTRLVLDHRGFPDGEARSLAEGWRANYWEPMAKVLR